MVAAQKTNRGGARVAGPGKKIGRPKKTAVVLKADAGIATKVLVMDGPPDHLRECDCRICKTRAKTCSCKTTCGDCGKLIKNCSCEETRPILIRCLICQTADDHKVCHCELCGWWELLLSRDRRIVHDTRKYLTDRRDGKPAQGVFVGDTRENRRELDFGDLPDFFTPGQSSAPGRPN